jgi:hypothetical protein
MSVVRFCEHACPGNFCPLSENHCGKIIRQRGKFSQQPFELADESSAREKEKLPEGFRLTSSDEPARRDA